MASYSGKGAPANGCIYVCNLPEGTDETMLAEYFGTIGEDAAKDMNGVGGTGRGRGDASGKTWQQEGDWPCPNTSCSNVNFAFRGVCNRCGTARPTGASGGGRGAGGRGRGRGAPDSGSHGRGAGATGALFGPNDWSCPMCGNINWAKRLKCNICNTNKPGHNEGGVRGGRAGGYKELDEEEIEETRRRRREAEEDDGEMYDEFGNLKKKFRAKTQQAEAGRPLLGSGLAGWEVEELGAVDRDGRERSRDRGRERDGRERSRDRGRERDDRESSKNRDGEDRERRRSRDYDYDRDSDYGRDREQHRDKDRERSNYFY